MKRVVREVAVYKGFSICKYGNRYAIYDSIGTVLRICSTKQECMDRIDEQTV